MDPPSTPTTPTFNFGTVMIYNDAILGVGSYGKVCRAKYGQLPCAAKLLHDTMIAVSDPGQFHFVQRFEQECQFLSRIKHPNIIQYLGTSRDTRSRRLGLLMELMDESLTKFLERSPGSIPYHIQLNICYDIGLALSYLHSNSIVHRDLSSNNVLLICDGQKAKVTDFGMSKLIDMNPRMTPLTLCPGATVYMPPEALTTPPYYTNKLDCFSLGVVAIQIATRKFPTPGDANKYIEDRHYPTGRVLVQFPETTRRKKDIDLVEPDHPILPLALRCLKDRDTDRPSADDLCERLSAMKKESRYTLSVERSTLHRLRREVAQKDQLIERERAAHQREIKERDDLIKKIRESHQNGGIQTNNSQSNGLLNSPKNLPKSNVTNVNEPLLGAAKNAPKDDAAKPGGSPPSPPRSVQKSKATSAFKSPQSSPKSKVTKTVSSPLSAPKNVPKSKVARAASPQNSPKGASKSKVSPSPLSEPKAASKSNARVLEKLKKTSPPPLVHPRPRPRRSMSTNDLLEETRKRPASTSSLKDEVCEGGTVKSSSSFDPEADAKALRLALKRFGTDGKAIIDILGHRSNEQRQAVRKKFHELYSKHLMKELKSELNGHFQDVILGLMMTPREFDTFLLKSMSKPAVIEILCTRTDKEIAEIKTRYKASYDRNLVEDVNSDTSGNLKNLLTSILTSFRDPDGPVNSVKVCEDVQTLQQVGKSKWGTDGTSKFCHILTARSYDHLKKVFAEYSKLCKQDIEEAIVQEVSGNLKEAMLTIVKAIRDQPTYFAERLYKSMKGIGTDHSSLVRVMVSRCEVDMVQIKKAFLTKYQKALAAYIKGDTSGDYKRILLVLTGDE